MNKKLKNTICIDPYHVRYAVVPDPTNPSLGNRPPPRHHSPQDPARGSILVRDVVCADREVLERAGPVVDTPELVPLWGAGAGQQKSVPCPAAL